MFVRPSRISLLALLFLLIPALLRAQTTRSASAIPARIVEAVNDAKRTALADSVPPSIRHAQDLGAAPASNPMNRIVLVLKKSDAQQKDLASLLESQHTQGSDSFHKWLTPEQFAARFGPSADDLAKLTGWLGSKGFSEIKVGRTGQSIEFSGTVASTQTAFGTSIHQFQTKVAGTVERHVANATPVSIPSALSPLVQGLLSLNDFRSKPLHTDFGKEIRNADGKMVRVKGDATSTDGNGNFSYALAPADLNKIYNATSLPAGIDGTGVSISVIGRAEINLTDLQTFRQIFALPANDPNILITGPDPGNNISNDAGESTLDLEWAGAVAPKATLNFVIAASTDTTDGIALSSLYAVENVISPILTVSYGSCEMHNGPSGNLFWNSLWQQAAAEGISVFVATGDGGAAICDADVGTNGDAVYGDTVNALASTPYNVAVGGTQFAENGAYMQYWDSNNGAGFLSALGYIPEAVWNESCDPTLPAGALNCAEGQTYYQSVGGGGGRSNCAFGSIDADDNVTCTGGYPKPSWQTGAGVPDDKVRDLPDVSLNASSSDDPYLFCFVGGCQYTLSGGQYSLTSANLVGGTSVSTPIMAAIMALVEQKNGLYQGQPDYTLYNLAAQSGNSCSSSARTDPTQSSTCTFNDVTVGNNGVPGLPGYGTAKADFTAGTGYDLATGLGSVNIANLVANWSTVTPPAATTTSLATTISTAKHGTAIPVQVAVTTGTGTPSGDIVLLTDKYGAGDQYTLDSTGAFSGNVSDLPGGTYGLTARYAGNASFATSTSPSKSLTITPEDSTPSLQTLVQDPNTGIYGSGTTSPYFGSTVYFKSYISGVSGQGTATGNVSVLVDGKTTLTSAPLTADSGALLSSTDIPVGSHAITVQYSGDNSFNPSTSTPVQVTIPKGQSVTYPTFTGGPNSITGAVLSVSGTTNPTGTLQLFDNGVAMGAPQAIAFTGVDGDGYAQIEVSHTYTSGQHTVQATYSGDSNYAPVALNSDSAYQRTINVTGNGTAPTTTTFNMTSPSTLAQGQIATFNLAVTAQTANGPAPTGQVFVYSGDNLLTGAQIVNGKASAIAYMDGAGVYNLRAQYQGDSTYATSVSANTFALTVPKLTPPITFTSSSAYALPGSQVSLNFTAAGQMINTYVQQDPTGTVTFADSLGGATSTTLGTFPLVFVNGMVGGYSGRFTLPTGAHLITATYNGNANFNAISASIAIAVQQPDFVLTGTPSALEFAAGTSGSLALSLAPVLGYSGTAALSCSGGVPTGSTCVVSPASLSLASAATATVTVTTPAPSPSISATLERSTPWKTIGGAAFAGALLLCLPRRRRFASLLPMLLVAALSFTGCGGGSSSPEATLLAVSSSNVKAASGSTVTLIATLSSLRSGPSGTVTFNDGTTALGSPVTVSGGTATLQVSSLAVGAHTITAVYSGDKNDVASTSTAITQVITGSTSLQITANSGTLTHTLTVPLTLN